jgi:hypothetical protein
MVLLACGQVPCVHASLLIGSQPYDHPNRVDQPEKEDTMSPSTTPKRPTETVGEAAWNTFRAVMLATLIALVAVIAILAWAANRPADTTDWSQFETPTTTQRF